MIALVPIAAIAIGVLTGLLMNNSSRDPQRRESPWPYIVGIVAVFLIASVTTVMR